MKIPACSCGANIIAFELLSAGISLTIDQWESLKNNVPAIEDAIKKKEEAEEKLGRGGGGGGGGAAKVYDDRGGLLVCWVSYR